MMENGLEEENSRESGKKDSDAHFVESDVPAQDGASDDDIEDPSDGENGDDEDRRNADAEDDLDEDDVDDEEDEDDSTVDDEEEINTHSNLDPGLTLPGITSEMIASMPSSMLLAHHAELRPKFKALKTNKKTKSSIYAAKSSSELKKDKATKKAKTPAKKKKSEMPPPLPAAKTYKISTIPPSGDESDAEDEIKPTCTPEELVDPLWTVEDAQDRKPKFGKYDCTVYADGTTIRGSDRRQIERYTRLLALQFPILGWCDGLYKPLKWIDMRCKSRNEMVAKKRKRRELERLQEQVATLKAKQASTSASVAKKQPSKAAAAPVRKAMSKTLPDKENVAEDADEEQEWSALDDDISPHQRAYLNVPRSATFERVVAGTVPYSGALSNFGKITLRTPRLRSAELRRNAASPVKTPSVDRQSRPKPKPVEDTRRDAPTSSKPAEQPRSRPSSELPSKQSSSKMTPTPKRKTLYIPTGPLKPTQTTVPASSTNTSDILIGPSTWELRAALVAFNELEEKKLIQETLLVLETAQSCGRDPREDGDKAFIEWLVSLENLVETDDEMRQSALRSLATDLSDDGATARISGRSQRGAASRIQIAKDIAKSPTGSIIGGTDPLCHNHIGQIAEIAQEHEGQGTRHCWRRKLVCARGELGRTAGDDFELASQEGRDTDRLYITRQGDLDVKEGYTATPASKSAGKASSSKSPAQNHPASSSKATTSSEASAKAGNSQKASSQKASSSAESGERQAASPKIAQRLKDAKLTERKINCWGQKKSCIILDLANIQVPKKKEAPAMLWEALLNGSVVLTAIQALQLELGDPIEGSVRPGGAEDVCTHATADEHEDD
ncbi:hypothetical protein V8E36_005788 [Tilletia maclaganii]